MNRVPAIVAELRKVKSLAWTRVQNDAWNRLSLFVYSLPTLRQVEEAAHQAAMQNKLPVEFIDYAMARWYTLKTHDLAVDLFCRHARVRRWPNPKDRRVDFELDGIPFDLKLTHISARQAERFPLTVLKTRPGEYAIWLYGQQSREERFGVNNRLFVACYDVEQPEQSWKLKRDWHRLAQAIDAYVARPTYHALALPEGGRVTSDVILVSK